MPIIKSAIKRMRQTAKRKLRNQQTKRSFRGEIKILNSYIQAKDTKKASESLKKVQAELDKAVKKNILKKNTAARKMSQLTAKVKAIGAKPTASTKTKPATPVKKTPAKTATKKPVAKKSPAKKTTTTK